MNLLMIIVVGVTIIFLDESSKDLPTLIEERFVCKTFNLEACKTGIIEEQEWVK